MKFAQLVMGPAGSGKSTYCSVIYNHCLSSGRQVHVVNLDPAAESFNYPAAVDVRNLVSVDDITEDKEMALGPNGALVFCMEYIVKNLDWLHDELNEGEDDYFLFDCPGQIELYSHLPIMPQLVDALRAVDSTVITVRLPDLSLHFRMEFISLKSSTPRLKQPHFAVPFCTGRSWDFNVCSVFLIDTHFVLEAEKFIAGALTALSVMVAVETPSVNVLTKIDLLSERNKALINDFLDTDTRRIVDFDTVTIWNERYRQLTSAIAQVLEDYSIVKFVPLNSDDEESIEQLLLVIDTSIQYGEGLDIKDKYPEDQDVEDSQYPGDEDVKDQHPEDPKH